MVYGSSRPDCPDVDGLGCCPNARPGSCFLCALLSKFIHGMFSGTLLDYSFSKGHLVYSTGSTAIQNTLLLHDAGDSSDFFLR